MAGNVVSATLRGGLFTRVVGKRLLFFQEIPSTMDEAARLAEAGAEEGTVVVAESQTAGRGRQGRNWISRGGNLYLSVIVRPTIRVLPLISMLAGVASARSISKVTGLHPRLKWPNDVMLNGKKTGGILVESVVHGDQTVYAVLGIGINIGLDTQSAEEIAGIATSLNAEAGRSVAPEDVLRQILHDLDSLYVRAAHGGDSPASEWTALLETLGQRVEARWGNEVYSGLAEGVDQLGNLQLRLEDGRQVSLTAGDVTLHNPVHPAGEGLSRGDSQV